MMGLALLAGFRQATQIRSSITALQTASELQTYPGVIAQQLTALRERLETREYTGQAHADLVGTVQRFNDDIQLLSRRRGGQSAQLQAAVQMWQAYSPVLAPVIAFAGEPYVDTDSGSSLSESGRMYYSNVRQAQLLARQNVLQLHQQLSAVSGSLQEQTSGAASRLRTLLSGGVLAALVLAAAAAYLQLTRAKHERAAREAQEQTRDILKTVREGFFLLDADYKIGSVWSEALTPHLRPQRLRRPVVRGPAGGPRPGGDPGDGGEVHQAALGRPRPREPDEEHQPAGTARAQHG